MISIPVYNELPDSFFEIPLQVYRNLPLRIEEDRNYINRLLQIRSRHAELQLFTDHQNIRLLGMIDKGSSTALFGFWETTHDFRLNQEAFGAFEQWSLSKGCTRIEGPKNFNTLHAYRLRLGTPSWLQFNREPVNPDGYPKMLEQLGYRPAFSFQSRLLDTQVIPKVYISKQQWVDQLSSLPFGFIPLNRQSWVTHQTQIFELVNDIFGENPGFNVVSQQEFELLYNADFAEGLCPHTSVLVQERSTQKLVAISLCQPNYLPLRLNHSPKFEEHYPLLEHRTLLAKTQGVHPDYRKQGLMNYLGAYGMLSFKAYYDDIVFCLMRDDNPSLRFTDPFPYERVNYALYNKDLR
ncbi:MAG: hypothetical protein ACK417_10270 [Bacteroidia bacterium]